MTAKRPVLSLIVLLAAISGCSRDPERTKRAYLESGNQYFSRQKYPEAIVEYRRATEVDPGFVEGHLKLAEAYVAADDRAGALREYGKVADLSPGDVHSQIKAGQMLLAAGLPLDAANRATLALQIDPNNIDALILQGNAAAGLPNNREDAEASFKRALGIQPNSADARAALANFEWTSGRTAEAEADFRRALALAPRHLLANRALAQLCATTGRLPEAERYLKTAAEVSAASQDQLSLADYYLRARRYDAAAPLLTAIASDRTMGVDARLRLANIDRVQGRKDQGARIVDEILAAQPHHTDALLMKAQFLVDDHKSDEALACLKLAADSDPRSDAARFALGKFYAENHRTSEAVSVIQEAIRINPDVAAYSLELAKIDLTRGDVDASLRHATEAASNAPNDPDVQLMLARGFIARRSLQQAEAVLRPLVAAQPKSATVMAELGALRFLQGNRTAARSAFEEALRLDPAADEALSALIQMDISDKMPQQAVARAEANLARRPTDVGAMLTAAGTYVLANESSKAEALLLKVIEAAPSTFKAYSLLGKMYVAAGKLDQAKTLFEGLSRRTPPVVGAYVMVGLVLEAQRKLPEAKSWYERALKVDPKAAVAANNLAWLHLTTGGDLETALQLARTAKAQLPSEPIVSDTLGWIYYANGSPELGIQMLQLCVDTDPKNATYRYHLGMLYAKAKDWPKAKEQLKLALSLNPNFDGAAEARATLASAPAK
jgi:tetratricopeptide (TPR) repeat protein